MKFFTSHSWVGWRMKHFASELSLKILSKLGNIELRNEWRLERP